MNMVDFQFLCYVVYVWIFFGEPICLKHLYGRFFVGLVAFRRNNKRFLVSWGVSAREVFSDHSDDQDNEDVLILVGVEKKMHRRSLAAKKT